MKKIIQLFLASLFIFISCSKEEGLATIPDKEKTTLISAVDISSYPEIANVNPKFYDLEGNEKEVLFILKENGINTIRLRLWVDPINAHSGFDEVKQFSKILKEKGFKIWLTLHYSDTWADPAHQEIPSIWKGLEIGALKEKVYSYTQKVTKEIQPDYIQIGNEINSGILHPYGNSTTNQNNFNQLLQAGCSAVRGASKECKIILHYAGIENSVWFFKQLSTIDYDIIGLSYYPIWHGKSLANLKTTLQELSTSNDKQILIAETAYPFTLKWNDWTTNIVGSEGQLIFPGYPATEDGQRNFIREVKKIILEQEKGIGFSYWGAELIAWKGNQSSNASSWENQALFNFENQALPVLKEFEMK